MDTAESAETVGVKTPMSLASKILSCLSMFFMTPSDGIKIASAWYNEISQMDIFALAVFGWCTVPMCEFLYNEYWMTIRGLKAPPKNFNETPFWAAASTLSQAVKVGAVVLAAECIHIAMKVLDMQLASEVDLGRVAGILGYTAWMAHGVAILKHYLLIQAVSAETGPLSGRIGETTMIDRLMNLAIGILGGLFAMDLLNIEMGAGLTSVFALGGMGTLVVSLAGKDLAESLLSGIFLHASDKFYEGDFVKLGDGTSGTVFKINWMYTLIRATDDTHLKIPNAQLAKLRVSNLSRVEQCQVEQLLYFSYSDMKKMPALVEDIKQSIQDACPKLITDGSRPFRVTWTDITEDRLRVVVNTHFDIRCFGDEYMDNRQKVLEAISEALDRNSIELAVPTYSLGKARIE